MWPIYNQPFQENPCDLFLDSFSVGLCKKVQHGAAKIMSVAVWVPQLIGNCIQEEIPTFGVQVHSQVLEDVHVRRVSYGAHGGGAALVMNVCDGLSPDIEHQCVDELEVVAIARLVGYL